MKIFILGDIHFPFHNKLALKKALLAIKEEKPTHVVQIGDLYDQYAFSRFTKKNFGPAQEELEEARLIAASMWETIQKYSRKTKCFQILGNHDVRMVKRVAERLPELQGIIDEKMREIYAFKGVTTLNDDKDILKIGDISFHHGYLSKLGDHLNLFGSKTVVGHSHVGGVIFKQCNGSTLWELNAGYLADETSEPLRYRPTKTSKWTLGYGVIDSNGPRFVQI